MTARVSLVVEAGSAASFEANWDQVTFVPELGEVFADGFESGSLGRWSAVAGQ